MDPASSAAGNGQVMPNRAEFDEEGYLQLHADIAQGVACGTIASGWDHFQQAGFAEGRPWRRQADPFAGVSREISPRDEMFTGNEAHYFDVGASAVRCIETALQTARRPRDTIKWIFDLPCGHGRVMRYLRHAFPEAGLVACDLNYDGVDFCVRTFGAIPEGSQVDPEKITYGGTVDLVWCGSLLTHLPEEKCRAFLRFFHRILGHRGLLVFTMHGRSCASEFAAGRNRHGLSEAQVAALLHDYRERGFSFVPYDGQPAYGFSLAHPAFVTKHFLDEADWRLLGHHEAGWDLRQDVICVQKSLSGATRGYSLR